MAGGRTPPQQVLQDMEGDTWIACVQVGSQCPQLSIKWNAKWHSEMVDEKRGTHIYRGEGGRDSLICSKFLNLKPINKYLYLPKGSSHFEK